jgi:hypothetical protein
MRDIYDHHNYHGPGAVYYVVPALAELTREEELKLANEAMKKALAANPGSHITIHPEEII